MKNYELAVLIDGESTLAKKKGIVETVEKIVQALGGEVGKVETWDKTDLAYKVGKIDSGIYLFFPLKLSPNGATSLKGKLSVEEKVVRHLLVVEG